MVSGTMPNLEKSNDLIPRKRSAREMSGGKDGQTLFHRILPATVRGLTSTTAVNWHLKIKDIVYDGRYAKNYCITVSTQKISSIHKLIQQILGSHELNGHAHLWPHPPQNHWITFSFPEFVPSCKNQFIPSIHSWDTVNFRVPPISDHTYPKNFWLTFSL